MEDSQKENKSQIDNESFLKNEPFEDIIKTEEDIIQIT